MLYILGWQKHKDKKWGTKTLNRKVWRKVSNS